MNTAIVISSNEKGNDFLCEILKSQAFSPICIASSGSEARRFLIENTFDLAIINVPIKDEFGDELALDIVNSTTTGVILLVKSEIADGVSSKVEDYGVFVIPKPINKQFFFQSLKLMAASNKRILWLKKENIKLQHKIDEIRLIDRAKCTLIQYLNLTEPQAHRYIEKQAMDMRVTKQEIAEGILKTYEN